MIIIFSCSDTSTPSFKRPIYLQIMVDVRIIGKCPLFALLLMDGCVSRIHSMGKWEKKFSFPSSYKKYCTAKIYVETFRVQSFYFINLAHITKNGRMNFLLIFATVCTTRVYTALLLLLPISTIAEWNSLKFQVITRLAAVLPGCWMCDVRVSIWAIFSHSSKCSDEGRRILKWNSWKFTRLDNYRNL